MNLITIYETKDYKVEIEEATLKFLEFIANSEIRLNPIAAEHIVYTILDKIANDFELKDKKVITTAKVPILNRNKIFDLSETYQGLEDALLLLSECFDQTKGQVTQEWKNNLSLYIKSHYILTYSKKCDIIFFDKKDVGVSGAIVLLDGDKLLILPISLNEDDFYQKLC